MALSKQRKRSHCCIRIHEWKSTCKMFSSCRKVLSWCYLRNIGCWYSPCTRQSVDDEPLLPNILPLSYRNWTNYRVWTTCVKKWVYYIIDDVEFDWLALFRILNSKVKPLSMTLSVDIILHHYVVFIVWNLLSKIEISAFKARLKYKSSFCTSILQIIYEIFSICSHLLLSLTWSFWFLPHLIYIFIAL